MKNRIYNCFIIILLFSLHTFLNAETNYVNKQGTTVETRYNVPTGYKRVNVEKGSFAEFLRNQKLKPYGRKLYITMVKKNQVLEFMIVY